MLLCIVRPTQTRRSLSLQGFMPPTLSTAQNKSMLVLDRISLSFGGRDLLDQVQWQVRPQDRVALIGANGSGKSTLMKIICGLQESDSGNITSPKSTTFGYLPQQGISFEGRTLFEEVRSVFADLLDIEVRLREMENRMGDELPDAEREELLETYDSLQEFFRQHDGYRLEAEVGHVLEGLGFGKEDWTRQCEHFSGGWQMRIALAKLLLERPSILLLPGTEPQAGSEAHGTRNLRQCFPTNQAGPKTT